MKITEAHLLDKNGSPWVKLEIVAHFHEPGLRVWVFRVPFWGKKIRVEVPDYK